MSDIGVYTLTVLRAIAVALVAAIVPGHAFADRHLDKAVSLWLAGDDEASVPMMAELAAEGHADARLLLGRIETSDLGPSPFRLSLAPEQSRALFRQADLSNFGTPWLSVEAKAGNELAQALLRSKLPTPDPDLIAELMEMGEYQATDYPTRILALYGDQEARDAVLRAGVLTDLKPYLAYLSGQPEPRGDGLAALRHIQPDTVSPDAPGALGMGGLLALGLGYGDISPDNPWRPAVEDWLMSAPSTRPIADLCRAECANEAPACAVAFMALTGGYYEVIRIDSPLETVIPQERFLSSPRAQLMMLRRAALARTETNQHNLTDVPQAAELSQCAVDLVRQQRSLYP